MKTEFKAAEPFMYKSKITGNTYLFAEYSNHGWGGVKNGFMDLPNEYPFEIIYKSVARNDG